VIFKERLKGGTDSNTEPFLSL